MRRLARLTPVDSGALLLITVVTLYVGTTNGHYSYDDAYITYRMADNFSRGLGFVYNPGEWHLGSTAAFYGLLVGSVRWFLSAISPNGAPPIPAIGGLISALSLLATGWMLYGLGRNHLSDKGARAPLCGLAAGLFYITNPMIFVTFGGELPFQIALITGAFFAYQQGARSIAAALAALAILTRPDGVQAAGVLLVYDIASRWKNTKGPKSWKTLVPWRELLTAAIILAPFIGAAWYAYGSPLPSTMAAKIAQRNSGLWGTYGRGLVDWVLLFLWNDKAPNLGFAPVNPPLVWLWALLGLAGIWRYRVFLPLVAWSAVFVLSYTAMRVPFYHWYAAPAAFGISILAGCGLCAVAELVEKWWTARGASPAAAAQVEGRKQAERVERVERAKAEKDVKAAEVIGTTALNRPALIISLAVLLLVAAAAAKPLLALPRTSQLNPTVRLYIEVGEWLQVNTMPEASVGYYEIGYIGFYGRRRMIDTLGLIDPEVSPAVARRDFTWALRVRRPDFILEKRGAGLNGFLGEQWFKDEYRSRAIMSVRGPSTEGVIIHERVARPAAAPAPVK
jgi:hypothetical protein